MTIKQDLCNKLNILSILELLHKKIIKIIAESNDTIPFNVSTILIVKKSDKKETIKKALIKKPNRNWTLFNLMCQINKIKINP